MTTRADPHLAVWARQFGPPEGLELAPVEPEPPSAGEVRVAVYAAGVGFADALVFTGDYQLRPDLPFIPGSEFSGIVEAVGEGVDPSLRGKRISGASFIGAFAQTLNIPERSVVELPADASFAEGAAFLTSYSTAYYALVGRGHLRAGESLLVMGASGAIGHAAVQLGKALGAFVVASATTADGRAAALEAGASAAIDAGSASWREDLRAANGGRPVDVAIDPVGGEATERAFRSLAWNGRLLVVGFAAGSIAKLPVNLALLKGASLIGVDNRQFYEKERDRALEYRRELLRMYANGSLKPRIHKVYPVEEYVSAIRSVVTGKQVGRVILAMRGVKRAIAGLGASGVGNP